MGNKCRDCLYWSQDADSICEATGSTAYDDDEACDGFTLDVSGTTFWSKDEFFWSEEDDI